MALTRDFRKTVRARARRDSAFRRALLEEGIECLVGGEVEVGKVVIRDYVSATMGFEQLGSLTERQPKGLMRMFGPGGNPQARNLFQVIACLQDHEGVHLEVKASGYSGTPAMTAQVAEEDGAFGR